MMKTMNRLIFVVVLTVLLGLGCTSEPDHVERNTVHALMSHDPPSMSLVGKTDRNSEVLARQITDSLVQYDSDMNLIPRVAESWSLSGDGKTITLVLRDGVRWHDGRPVTSADVLFTVELVRDPAVESIAWSPDFRKLASIEAPDDRTVRATFEEANPDMLEAWRVPLIPAHLAESGVGILTGEYARRPVGCGPFRFVRYRTGEEIVLEANDDYWDGRPFLDRLVLHIHGEQRTSFQALLKGDIDIMAVTSNLWREAQESEEIERLSSFVYYNTSVYHIRWNQDGSNPFFNDVQVRRAMMLALDRERFLETMLHGLGMVATTTWHPELSWTDPDLEPIPYDPEEARLMLKEAGWEDTDGDGIVDRDSVPFSFTLMVPASTQKIVDHLSAWLQQSWAEVGVRVVIDRLEWKAFRERRKNSQYQANMGSVSFTLSPDQWQLFHSEAVDPDVGYNQMHLIDHEVDRLSDLGRLTFDVEARREIYFKLQRRIHELQPIGCLVNFANPVLHDRRLHGVRPSLLDYWRTTDGPRLWRWAEPAEGP